MVAAKEMRMDAAAAAVSSELDISSSETATKSFLFNDLPCLSEGTLLSKCDAWALF